MEEVMRKTVKRKRCTICHNLVPETEGCKRDKKFICNNCMSIHKQNQNNANRLDSFIIDFTSTSTDGKGEYAIMSRQIENLQEKYKYTPGDILYVLEYIQKFTDEFKNNFSVLYTAHTINSYYKEAMAHRRKIEQAQSAELTEDIINSITQTNVVPYYGQNETGTERYNRYIKKHFGEYEDIDNLTLEDLENV